MRVPSLLGLGLLLTAMDAMAASVTRIPRENGAVHAEFIGMIRPLLTQLPEGVGRIELNGEADGDECSIQLYSNTDTTFVTLNVDEGRFYTEFYIDHPTQSFRSIMFQTLTTEDEHRELRVISREGEYAVGVDEDSLSLTVKTAQSDSPLTCTAAMEDARFHPGQTE